MNPNAPGLWTYRSCGRCGRAIHRGANVNPLRPAHSAHSCLDNVAQNGAGSSCAARGPRCPYAHRPYYERWSKHEV